MPGGSLLRFVVLAAFILAVALGLWLVDVDPPFVVVGVALAWVIASLFEWLAWRDSEPRWPSLGRRASPSPPAPVGEAEQAPGKGWRGLRARTPGGRAVASGDGEAGGPAAGAREEQPREREADALPEPVAARLPGLVHQEARGGEGEEATVAEPAAHGADEPPREREVVPPERVTGRPVDDASRERERPPEPAAEDGEEGRAARTEEPREHRPWFRRPFTPDEPPRPFLARAEGPGEPPRPELPADRPAGAASQGERPAWLGRRTVERRPLETQTGDAPAGGTEPPRDERAASGAAESPAGVSPGAPVPASEEPPRAEDRPAEEAPREPAPGAEEPARALRPAPPERPVPPPTVPPGGRVVPLRERSREPRQWNLWELERLVRAEARRAPARADEWSYLVLHLRPFADAGGALPREFDGLVRESFGTLLEELEPA
ncbi:MAG: hypothetical protein ICV74_09850 [Thermoleophilia bacterium]|nr:hypothetical protein [Thermoleophilia bacterium]